MKTRCMIVDDEPLAIEVIESHLSHFENIEIIARCRHAMEAFEVLKSARVDILFLDIQMPYITGIDFIRSLKNPPKIILTTAYREYAPAGFDLDVLDYLLKPIAFKRFLKAMNKYFEWVSLRSQGSDTSNSQKDREHSIFVKADRKNHKILLKDILFIESSRDYILIRTQKRVIMTKIPISRIAKQLPEPDFIRIHRSYIVSVDKINSFNREMIEITGKELPIGRNYRESVMNALNC